MILVNINCLTQRFSCSEVFIGVVLAMLVAACGGNSGDPGVCDSKPNPHNCPKGTSPDSVYDDFDKSECIQEVSGNCGKESEAAARCFFAKPICEDANNDIVIETLSRCVAESDALSCCMDPSSCARDGGISSSSNDSGVGSSTSACQYDSECGSGATCIERACVRPQCGYDSDCGDCARCSNGKCHTCPVGLEGVCSC